MAKMKSSKRSGRNGNRPTNKRYKSENRREKNKIKRAARITRALLKAATHRAAKLAKSQNSE